MTLPDAPSRKSRKSHRLSSGSWLLALPLALLLVAQAGCAEAPRDVPTAASEQPSTPAATSTDATLTDATPDAAMEERDIVLDLRHETAPFQADAEETRRIVAATFGDGAPEDLELTARASGHFTATDQRQTAYILLRRVAMQPHGDRLAKPMLAIFDQDGQIVTQFVADFPRIAAVADLNGDGLDEILLAADTVHMGLFATAIQVVSLRDNDLKVLDTHHEAFLDSCEQRLSARAVRATVFVRGPSGLAARHYHTDCDGDPATRASRFQRVPGK